MSIGWVAAATRARALRRRRLGRAGALELAARPFPDALRALSAGPYGHDVTPGDDLATAQFAVAATLLWHLRVLAGWVPRAGVDVVRLLAGWFEIADVDEHLRELAGRPAEPRFRLGGLATAWPRLAAADRPAAVRAVLAASPWGDPGGERPYEIGLGMRLSWAARVAATVPGGLAPAAAGAAVYYLKERFVAGRYPPDGPVERVRRLLGGATTAPTFAAAVAALPAPARWPFAGVDSPGELWRAEAAWWRRLERDALAGARRPGQDAGAVVATVMLLAADAWRVRAALEVAARGLDPGVLDEIG